MVREKAEGTRRFPGCRNQNPEPIKPECPWQKEALSCRYSLDLVLTELFVCKEVQKLLPVLINSASAHGSIYFYILKISAAFS